MVADQVRKSFWSATGTPSSSQITVIGSGNANEASRSTSRRVDMSSSSPAVIAVIRGLSRGAGRLLPAEPGGPPVPPPDQHRRRGHQQRPDQEGVHQHAKREADADVHDGPDVLLPGAARTHD